MSRALLLLLACAALSLGVSCQRSPSQPPASGALPSRPPALGELSPEEREAVDLAQAFLAKEGTDWGRPSRVRRAEVEYYPGWKGWAFTS
jgi:hypothetical protein